ncbi:LysM peptidoglycan-binding domain-containing protein [Solitalea koreensis]|uniref:Membrane-bound lytic murein transglycosylase D n=1 Tax=Solitalea koreensis TaxID=543615 RepID=A0A521CRF0_9SPHI|nr:LysM peptidoglycan-binding domain-containing protein [Solitalea koreensis]SMO62049.1 membrane-bound lytic murein transglycosylase D [Solitalea koreensis]
MNRSLFALAFLSLPFATLANSGVHPLNSRNTKLNGSSILDSTLLADGEVTKENSSAKPKDTLFVLSSDPAEVIMSESDIIKGRLDSIKSQIPMDYNEYVQAYIDLYINKRKGLVARMLGTGKYYFPIFEKYLSEEGLPIELKYLPVIESALNANAVSKVGATGLWQFMYGTAKMYDMNMNYYIDERRDPVASTIAATQFLGDLYDRYSDWLLAIAAYNCGPGNVDRAISRAGGSNSFWDIRPYLPRETANYVPAFIAATYAMTYAEENDIVAEEPEFSSETDTVLVNRSISLPKLASTLNLSDSELKLLNPKYRKLIVKATAETPQTIVLPKASKEFYASLDASVLDNSTVSLSSFREHDDLSYCKVKKGDNLGSIASRYNCSTTDLKKWNGMRSNRIVAGQRLKIYSSRSGYMAITKNLSKTRTYKVRSGDTLSTIAAKFSGMTVEKLKKLNNLKNAKNIRPGMTLKVSI